MKYPTPKHGPVHRPQRPIPKIVPARELADYVDDSSTEIDPFPAGAALERVMLRSRSAIAASRAPLLRTHATMRTMHPRVESSPRLPLPIIAAPRIDPEPSASSAQLALLVPLGLHYSYVEDCTQRFLKTQRVNPLPAVSIPKRSFGKKLHGLSRFAAPIGALAVLLIVVVVGLQVLGDGRGEPAHSDVRATTAPIKRVAAPAAEPQPAAEGEPAKAVETTVDSTGDKPSSDEKSIKPAKKRHVPAKRRPIRVNTATALGNMRPS